MSNFEIAKSGMFYWMTGCYLALRKQGEEGIRQWQEIMDRGLSAGYVAQGATRNSGPEAFLKYAVERDKMLGLPVGGRIIGEKSFLYWIQDPMLPQLKKTNTKRTISEYKHTWLCGNKKKILCA